MLWVMIYVSTCGYSRSILIFYDSFELARDIFLCLFPFPPSVNKSSAFIIPQSKPARAVLIFKMHRKLR